MDLYISFVIYLVIVESFLFGLLLKQKQGRTLSRGLKGLNFIASALLGMVARNHSTQEAEAGGSRVQGQPGLHGKTLSQKKKCLGLSLP
jgi:hypothetical protein